MVLELRT
jgi:hypothetical protein